MFLSYFVVTVTVTIIQMIAEFRHVKSRVKQEIQFLSESFSPGIAEALWRYDKEGITSTLFGMIKQNAILGIAVFDLEKNVYQASGWIKNAKDEPLYIDPNHVKPDTKIDQISNSTKKSLGTLYRYSFPLSYTFQGETSRVGSISIFSGSNVVMEQVKYGFIIILISFHPELKPLI